MILKGYLFGLDPRRAERLIVIILGGYFFLRLLFFAAIISPEIPPDEITHVGRVEVFSKARLLPENTPDSYRYELVTRVPYLYYLLMAKLLVLKPNQAESYFFLRLANVALSMATIAVSYWFAALLTKSRRIRILFLVMVTNTLMFTFLSASVSYDNLVNFFAVLSFIFLARLIRHRDSSTCFGFILCVLLGCLTKTTFLPLAIALVVVFFLEQWIMREFCGKGLVLCFRPRGWQAWGLGVLSLLALVANLHLYGGNFLRYGRVVPGCSQVLEVEQCMENRVFARNWILSSYRSGSLSFEEAVEKLGRIRHRGDRRDALILLRNERQYKKAPKELLNRYAFATAAWKRLIEPSIFGIVGHVSMAKNANSLWPYDLIFLVGFVLWARFLRWKREERIWLYLAAVPLAYFTYLVGVINYQTYESSHYFGLSVQGRYLFVVLIPAYLVLARSLLLRFSKPVQVTILILASAVFVLGDYPYFRSHVTETWLVDAGSIAIQ